MKPGITGSADIIEVAREVEKDHSLSEDAAAKIVSAKMAASQHHSSLWYRVNATRLLTGGHKLVPNVSKTMKEIYEHVQPTDGSGRHGPEELEKLSDGGKKAVIEFTASSCAVLESEGSVRIGIRRFGNTNSEVTVSVETIDGSAEAGNDYKPIKQKLTFKPKETLKEIFIEIIDDDVWEPDEFFFVKLFLEDGQDSAASLGKVSINQVTIVNDDDPGKFEFSKPSYIIKESADKVMLNINRVNGADGEVCVSWKTKDLSAKNGVEYMGGDGKIRFKHGETSKVLPIQINKMMASEHEPNFQVELSGPTGGAEIGKIAKTIVTIINDEEFNNMVSRIANKTKKNLDGLRLDTSSWAEQFHDAFNVNGGDAENTTVLDYIMHFMTFFWKVVFAFIPPPSIGGGWLTFFLSLAMIGFLTAIISDLASVFGCLIGLSNTITAITLVALGTSMPDTFASKQAAINEIYADSSVGNINGSNSVNVFLGMGLPWLIATIYWKIKGKKFHVPTGSLGFSVVLYTSCAVFALVILMLRRYLSVFGKAELGGPKVPKIISAVAVFFLWVFYIVLSSLQAQHIIDVGF
ncbi:sodium/calcium exchanger 2-like [Patella vulgata]|uniref:sodium/calcium exchanger 2-like n=1 Tax=Patella vulgata TaxID=6465 RepID=UPI00217F599E|nr:sodium/calcium exchanger 2-like [Patella vulgata]